MAETEKRVALLRGINVGGKRLVPMKTLAGLVEKAGGRDVVTYIQSGNVVFTPSRQKPDAAALSKALESELGFAVPVVVRSHAELVRCKGASPFAKRAKDPKHLHVSFLSEAPTPERIAALDPSRSPGDELRVIGAELHLHLPNGVGKSKLTSDYLDRTLGVVGTIRNWATLGKLIELSA